MLPRPEKYHDIPGAGRALWRAFVFAYHAEPRLLIISFVLITGAMVPEALNALWLKLRPTASIWDGRVWSSRLRSVSPDREPVRG
jgi:hypothetical protein